MRATEFNYSIGLFVYGTLMSEKVLTALLGRVPEMSPAEAKNIETSKVKDKVYPFASERIGAVTRGYIICPDKHNEEWQILDFFEDKRYELDIIETSKGKAWCYIDKNAIFKPDGHWSFTHFEKSHLNEYEKLCKTVRKKYFTLNEHNHP